MNVPFGRIEPGDGNKVKLTRIAPSIVAQFCKRRNIDPHASDQNALRAYPDFSYHLATQMCSYCVDERGTVHFRSVVRAVNLQITVQSRSYTKRPQEAWQAPRRARRPRWSERECVVFARGTSIARDRSPMPTRRLDEGDSGGSMLPTFVDSGPPLPDVAGPMWPNRRGSPMREEKRSEFPQRRIRQTHDESLSGSDDVSKAIQLPHRFFGAHKFLSRTIHAFDLEILEPDSLISCQFAFSCF